MAVYYDKTRDAWVVDVTDEWGRRRRKFLKAEIAARALEANLKRTIAEATLHLARGALPDLKLTEAVELFLAQMPALPITRIHNAQRLKALIKIIGDPSIHDVTPQLLATYQARRKGEVSIATLAYEAQVAFRFFRFLTDQGYLQTNPARALERKQPRTSPGRELTDDEENKILRGCTERIQLRLLLALDAGLRRGEVMRLKRRDWNKTEHTLTVWRPKTRTSTILPLTQRLQQMLHTFAGHLAPDSIISTYGSSPVRKGTDVLKKLRARTAVPFRFHDLRHTFATRLRRVASFEIVRHLLGHAPTTTTERYIHPSLEDARQAIDAMEQRRANP